jgi:hypothetical protein
VGGDGVDGREDGGDPEAEVDGERHGPRRGMSRMIEEHALAHCRSMRDRADNPQSRAAWESIVRGMERRLNDE